MYCNGISLTDFRNIEQANVSFDAGVNILYGNNAQGKTNLLEAVYYAALGKSFRGQHAPEVIRFGAEGALLSLDYTAAGRAQNITMRLFQGRARAVEKNKVRISKMSELVGSFRAVLFCPEHLSLIKGGPAERRQFLDIAVSASEPVYLATLQRYAQILKQRNRLSVALMLESHLDEMEKQIFAGAPLVGKNAKKQARDANRSACTCFVCDQMGDAMEKMLATVCRTYETQKEFCQLFEDQPCLCLPHFSALVEASTGAMSKKAQPDFAKEASKLARRYLTELRGDVHHFCEMYDHRNAGSNDWGNSKDSIERAIWYLTTREP